MCVWCVCARARQGVCVYMLCACVRVNVCMRPCVRVCACVLFIITNLLSACYNSLLTQAGISVNKCAEIEQKIRERKKCTAENTLSDFPLFLLLLLFICLSSACPLTHDQQGVQSVRWVRRAV